jgi:acetyltransferase
MNIRRVHADELPQLTPQLSGLLQDAVTGGASIGFLPPLSQAEADSYWQEVAAALNGKNRLMLIAEDGGTLVGTVQLDLAGRANGSHRAEVAKLMVHSARRRRGIARLLMQAIEEAAHQAGRTTLILDTREGDPSEQLYLKMGYTRAGTIPEYARSTDGTLHTTVFMYKLLK